MYHLHEYENDVRNDRQIRHLARTEVNLLNEELCKDIVGSGHMMSIQLSYRWR